MDKNIRLILFLSIFLLFVSTACHSNNEDEHNDARTIYTSIYPLQYIVEQLAGDDIIVKSIYPPGSDAHTFEPTSKQLTEIAQAHMFIYMGGEMESVTDHIADALHSQDVALLELSNVDGLLEDTKSVHHHEHDQHHEHDHSNLDPHVWLDPLKMIDMAKQIKHELLQLNLVDEKMVSERFREFTNEMKQLDEAYSTRLKEKENKQIIVTHAAYGYWVKRYGIQQLAIRGISTEEEPSQQEIVDIVQTANDNDIQSIIFDQYGTDKVAEIIQEHIEVEALYLHNLEILTDEDIKNGEDYITLMKKNLEVLDQATQ